jgi:hypothetical protein
MLFFFSDRGSGLHPHQYFTKGGRSRSRRTKNTAKNINCPISFSRTFSKTGHLNKLSKS